MENSLDTFQIKIGDREFIISEYDTPVILTYKVDGKNVNVITEGSNILNIHRKHFTQNILPSIANPS